MPRALLIVAVLSSIGFLSGAGRALGQQQSRAADTSQPQKKPAKPGGASSSSGSSSSASSQPSSAQKSNPFPEDVSRKAAQAPQNSGKSDKSADDNPFPEAVSQDAAKAARDAGSNPSPASEPKDLPPGVSSSRSNGIGDAALNPSGRGDLSPALTDPTRAKEDTRVGTFYMQTGNYHGAYLRYKDAVSNDPTNVDALFGLAQASRELKNYADARENYSLYLQILPHGPKAKQARKELGSMPAGK